MWLMTPTKTRPHKPMLAEWTSEILSLSLCNKTSWECGCLDTQPLLTGNLTGAGCKGRQGRGQTVWDLGGILASPQPEPCQWPLPWVANMYRFEAHLQPIRDVFQLFTQCRNTRFAIHPATLAAQDAYFRMYMSACRYSRLKKQKPASYTLKNAQQAGQPPGLRDEGALDQCFC